MEAEQCILILENEYEKLKSARDELIVIEQLEERNVISEKEVQDLQNSISTLEDNVLKKDSDMLRMKSVITFFSEAVDASTVEDLALLIFQSCNDLGSQPMLLVTSPARVMELSQAGSLPEREKRLIKSLQSGEVNSTSSGGKIYFNFSCISGCVQKNNSGKFDESEKRYYVDFFRFSDKLIKNISQTQSHWSRKRTLDSVSNAVKMMAGDMDVAVDNLISHSVDVVRDSFGQLQDVGRSAGMSASQIASIKKMENSALTDLRSDSMTKLRMRKSVLSILKQLESADMN